MSKLYRNAILALSVVVATAFVGANGAMSQTEAPKPAASVPHAANTSAATAKPKNIQLASAGSHKKRISHGRVYLLRGLLNVFSLGMDDLAAKLERRGISAGVYEYGGWESICQEAAARYRAGGGPIILVGHSLGADAVVDMSNRLGQMGIPVALIVAFDPTAPSTLNGRTTRSFVNYYQSDNGFGRPIHRGSGFHGSLSNIDLRKHTEFGHASIDKSAMLHRAVIGRVLGLVGGGGGSKKASKPAAAKPAAAKTTPASKPASTPHAETKPAAKPETQSATAQASQPKAQ